MKSFQRLSFTFKTNYLLKDYDAIKKHWQLHFNRSKYDGHWDVIQLRSPLSMHHPASSGYADSVYQDTSLLDRMHYFKTILAQFNCPITSVRLLKLSAGSVIKKHVDPDLRFWSGFVRLHIPILTNDQVTFFIDEDSLHMRPGECWFAEFCLPHAVQNLGTTDRVHLVIDLKVNDWLKQLFEKEGIIYSGEVAPDPIDGYSKEEKAELIASLKEMNTQTSRQLAREYATRYQLTYLLNTRDQVKNEH
ncbi:MAG: aspartyl/asparaginyl beta-hydroxylase domain-containing protein [Bacteroidota bacterium]